MKKRNLSKKLQKLKTRALFTTADAKAIGISSSLLCYYVNKGTIQRVGRGIYKYPETEAEMDFRWEDLVLIIKGIPNGVVCLTTALALYDLTEEIPRMHWIAIPHASTIPNRKKCKFIRMRNTKLGKTKLKIADITIPIFNRERTIIDSFRHLSKETAIKALKIALADNSNKKISLKLLQKYSKELRVNIDPYLLAVTT